MFFSNLTEAREMTYVDKWCAYHSESQQKTRPCIRCTMFPDIQTCIHIFLIPPLYHCPATHNDTTATAKTF